MDVCTNPEILKVIYFFLLILDIVKIVIPIALIILGLIDFSKSVIINDEKIQKKSVTLFFKRILYGVLIFAVPWIIEVLMVTLGNLLGEENKINFTDCIENANSKKIAELEENYKNEEDKNKHEEDNNKDEENKNDKDNSCKGCYEQVKPSGSGNIKYKEETDTLKVVIELNKRKSGLDYYTTYIWVKDAYKQFKSQVPDNYGKKMLFPEKLMENAIEENNLQKKLVVGFNASGYLSSGVYKYSPEMPLVISNGKVIRDYTNKGLGVPKYNTYGINKNGELKFYSYAGGDLKKVAKKIQDDGVLNTFGFVIKLVENGKVATKNNNRNVLQGICQIDKNNFVFVTDVYGSSRNGFRYKELAEYMISLGCKTGYNLDGGGSVQLIYKASNGTPQKLITENNRKIPDVIYFHQ